MNVRFSKPGNNDVPFLVSDVQQSLHAAMRRKNVPCEYVEKTMPTSGSLTGPWEQTMAATAALELVKDMYMTLYSANDEGKTIEVEVTVLDQTGQPLVYNQAP